jgi:hypothetical protein
MKQKKPSAWGSKSPSFLPYSNSKIFSINSYIPEKLVGAIVIFDRARRAPCGDLRIFRGFFTLKIIIINEITKYF